MLRSLSGRTHQVCTGLTVCQGGHIETEPETTLVTFRGLSDREIDAYIATGDPMDKAGAYGVQGKAALFVSGIQGDYFNVMGLPLHRLGQMLGRFGLDLFSGEVVG
jgi:septum formation protein